MSKNIVEKAEEIKKKADEIIEMEKEKEPVEYNIMEREHAISYLKRKEKLDSSVAPTPKDEKKISKVMREGKIYGDPMVKLFD